MQTKKKIYCHRYVVYKIWDTFGYVFCQHDSFNKKIWVLGSHRKDDNHIEEVLMMGKQINNINY